MVNKIKLFINNNKKIIIIYAVSLLCHLFIFNFLYFNYGPGSYYLDKDGLTANDTQHYVVIANNLVQGNGYSRFLDPPYQPDGFRTPLMAFYFVPFIYFLGFGSIWLAMLVLNLILSLIPVFTFLLARLFISEKLSFIAGLLIALELLFNYRSNIAEPDALFILLILLAVYQLILFLTSKNQKRIILSACWFGLATLAKPVGIYLLGLTTVFLAVYLLYEKYPLGRAVKAVIILNFIFGLIVFPWLWRNQVVFKVWSFSSVAGYNFYKYYTNDFKLPDETLNISAEVRDPLRYPPYQNQYLDISLNRIKNQPYKYAAWHLTGALRNLLASEFPAIIVYGHGKLLPFQYERANQTNLTKAFVGKNYLAALKYLSAPKNFLYTAQFLIWLIFYLLILLGWLKSFKEDKKAFIIFSFFIVMLAYFALAAGPGVDAKYRLPAMPFLAIVLLFLFQKNRLIINTRVL